MAHVLGYEIAHIDKLLLIPNCINLLDQLILSIADDCEIAHNHPPYWDKLEDRRGLFGKVMILNAVSWLHVSGWLRGVHAGKYRIVWRLFILPQAANIFDIDFCAETSMGCVCESQLPYKAGLLEFGSDYFDFALPSPLKITAPFEDVHLECKSTSSIWKTNIALCSVRLEPIDQSPHALRYRQSGYRAVVSDRNIPKPLQHHLKSSAWQSGVNYHLWKPWRMANQYETVCLSVFAALAATVFAYLLLSQTS
ncbi:hypothetical protein H4R24_000693 [Coemansia sp. RSA 988]|nr:hypothetical protein H4R24_000693 [Coemansia sp. RSA 988]